MASTIGSRSNKSRVLAFLQKGTGLSTAQARSFFKIQNVSPVVTALRGEGHDIRQYARRSNGRTVTVYLLNR